VSIYGKGIYLWADRFSKSMLSVIVNSRLYLTYVPTSFREHLSDYERKWAMTSFSKMMQQFTQKK